MENMNMNELATEIENGIRKRLDKTEAWAREHFDGPSDLLNDFVYDMRSQTLNSIIQKIREAIPGYVEQNQVVASNQN
jgi:hypothetical protein